VIVRCYLPSHSLAQVQRAFPPPHGVENAATWDVVLSDLRDRRCDVAIIDPCTDGDHLAPGRLGALAVAMRGTSPVPVIGYVSVTACAMRAVQGLVQLGASEIAIRGVDDSIDALATAVRRAVAACASARVVTAVGTPWHVLPVPVATAIQMAFNDRNGCAQSRISRLRRRTTRRSLDRCSRAPDVSGANGALVRARECRVPSAHERECAGHGSGAAGWLCVVALAHARALRHHRVSGVRHSRTAVHDVFAAAIARRLVRHAQDEAVAVRSY
jgi:hypothetical protein